MTRPSIKELQRQVREDAILDAARELIGEQGYADMSMDDLAARVGISKATLYQHFPSKEEVAINVIVGMMRRGEELLTEVDPHLPAIQGIEQWLRRGLSLRMKIPSHGMNLMPLSVRRHPLYLLQEQRIHTLVSALIDRAKAEGDASPQLATPVAARMMMRLFSGEYDDFTASGQLSHQDVVVTLVALVMNGLRVRREDQ